MPELPEVEITVRDLKKKVLNRTFIDVWTDAPKLIKKPRNFQSFKKEIINKKIKEISRRGKNIIFELSRGKILLIHQKLTGHLLFGKWKRENNIWVASPGPLSDKMNSFIHVVFLLDNEKQLALSDLRKFAKIELWDKDEFLESDEFRNIGLDPLSPNFSFLNFKKLIKKNREIKKLLMDQKLIAGIGNIYSSEILFDAMIHPLKKGMALSDMEIRRLYQSTRKILRKGLELGGASISDYRRINGERGKFDKYRKVYRKEGNPCPRCGTPIKKIIVGGRSAYFCPKCQKL